MVGLLLLWVIGRVSVKKLAVAAFFVVWVAALPRCLRCGLPLVVPGPRLLPLCHARRALLSRGEPVVRGLALESTS